MEYACSSNYAGINIPKQNCVSFSCIGSTVCIMDWLTGVVFNRNCIRSIAIRPDGKYKAICKDKSFVVVGDTHYPILEMCLNINGECNSVAFSDNNKLAATNVNAKIMILEMENKKFHEIKGHIDNVKSVVFSHGSDWIASGCEDNMVCTWDLATCQNILSLSDHTRSAICVAVSPDNNIIASGSKHNGDGIIRLWDVRSGKQTQTIDVHDSEVESVSFNRDGKYLASGSSDESICIWDFAANKPALRRYAHDRTVTSVAFSTNSDLLLAGSNDMFMTLHELYTDKYLTLKRNEMIQSVAFDPVDDMRVYYGGSKGFLTPIEYTVPAPKHHISYV